MKTYRFIFLVISVCTSIHAAANDNRNLKFDMLTINDGLSQGMVNCIIQDHFGFMWFATKDGLNRYDGYTFTVYRHSTTDINSIADNFISFLYEDSHGRIWIATANNGLDLFDRETESFIHFRQNESDRNTLSDDRVTVLSEDKFGCIWAGTVSGLNRISISQKALNKNNKVKIVNATKNFFDNYNVEVTRIIFDASNPEHEIYSRKKNFPLSDVFASNFFVDQSGFVWVSTQEMLFKIKPLNKTNYKVSKLEIEKYCTTKNFDNGLEKFVQLFVEDTANHKIYFVFEYGITSLDIKTGLISVLSDTRNTSGVFGHPAAIDVNGNIWTSEDNILEQFNVNSKKWISISSSDDKVSQMCQNINCSYRDKSGNIWLGTKGYGLLKYNPRSEKFNTTDRVSISWMATTTDNKIIINKYAHLLSIFDSEKNEYEQSIADSQFKHLPYFTDFGITDAILQDTDGTFWLGKQRLYHYLPATGSIEKFRDDDETVFPLFDDGEDNLWFSTENKFVMFNKTTKQSVEYDYPISTTRVPYDFLQAIYRDKKNIFWLGTVSGLLSFNPENQKWNHYFNIPSDTTSLSFDLIFSICPDPFEPQNYLWIGTNGGGLNRFNKTTGKALHFTQLNGLPNDVVYGILSDADGNLWMSTNKGISRFNIKTKTFRNFAEKDGLQGDEFNRYAFCKTKNNMLFFGGVNGFNFFDPKELSDNTFNPNVVITDIKLNNISVNTKSENAVITKPAYLLKEIELKYSQNILTIEFASLDYTASKNNLYQYQLEGFDSHWIQSGTNHSATFTNLDPGTYTFNVKGSNNDGVFNETPASLVIIVLPPWYMTWWFRLAVALVVAASAYSFYRYRINKILEMQEVRNTIARDLHDEIGSNLSTISIFSEVASAHLRTDDKVNPMLKKITEYTQLSQEAMSDIVWMINSKNDRFENVIFRMQSLATEMIEAKNIQLNFVADEKLKQTTLDMNKRKNFYLIFKEALNNIIKYSHASEVTIELKSIDNNISMTVNDNGTGFDSTLNSNKKMGGNGLMNMEKRARALNGTLKIESVANKGTSVELFFRI